MLNMGHNLYKFNGFIHIIGNKPIRSNKMSCGKCPECEFGITVESPREGEVLECGDCGANLEIVNANNGSLEFSVAASTEEDWGE